MLRAPRQWRRLKELRQVFDQEKRRSERTSRLKGIGWANLATLVWATNMVLGRMLKDAAGPFTISAIRFIIAAALFGLLLRHRPAEDRRFVGDFWPLAGMALSGVVLFSPVLYLGLRYTTAVNCTLVNALSPMATGLFAALLINEPMSRRQIAGAAVAFAGVAFLISGGSLAFWQNAAFNAGDLIVLGAVVLWGVYAVVGRTVMRRRSPLSATALSTFIGVPPLIVLAILEQQVIPAVIDARLLLAIAYIGFVPTALGFYAWNAGVARLGPSGAAVFYNTLPLFGAGLGFAVLGEPIGLPHLVGGLLIVAGGLWAAGRPLSAG